MPDIRIGRQNLLHCGGNTAELLSRIYRLKQFLDNRRCWISEAQKLVIISILVPTADCESKSIVLDWDVVAPVLWNNLFSFDSHCLHFINNILSEAFTPQTWIDLIFFAVVGRELA